MEDKLYKTEHAILTMKHACKVYSTKKKAKICE